MDRGWAPLSGQLALESVGIGNALFIEQDLQSLVIGLGRAGVGDQLGLGDVELQAENRKLLDLVACLGKGYSLREALQVLVVSDDRMAKDPRRGIQEELLEIVGGMRGQLAATH